MRRALLAIFLVGSLWADELKRPSTDLQGNGAGCIGLTLASSTLPLAYDAAGATTFSTLFVSSVFVLPHNLGDGSRTQNKTRRIQGWTATGNTYLGLTLNILSSSPGATGTGGNACFAYSLNSGTSWTSIRCSGSAWTLVTDSVSLPLGQDLTTLQVAACTQANGNDPNNESSDSIKIYDIWTLGTNTPQGAGNGSTSGQPHRGLLIAN